MESTFLASKLINRSYFKSYSEFYFALALSNVLHERGLSVDMSNVSVDVESLTSDYIQYYKKLVSVGAIDMNLSSKSDAAVVEDSKVSVDTSYFKDLELFYEEDGKLHWSFEHAKENYKEHSGSFLSLLTLGNSLLHLVAYHIADVLTGKETRKLVLHFDEHKTKSTFLYVNIYSCLYSIAWLNDYVELDLQLGDTRVDLDYSIFCNNSKKSGHRKIWSTSEKIEFLKKFGIVENSIVALWKRSGMCDNNEFGKIDSADIVLVREIGDDFIGVTKIALNKTKEEVLQDYYDIPEKDRYLFIDILDKKPHQKDMIIEINQIGVDDYFYDEDKFIMLLDNVATVKKLITVEGQVVQKDMTEVDSIYWLLCQYNIEFDRDLFREMYMSGEDALWDIFGEEE